MNNFKDYLNLSPNTRDNFYNLSRMTGEQEYYMKLCESLQQKINILEAKMKKKKKNKKADKDYDGDGKVESGKEEYFGSKDKAIKAAMEKKKSLKEGREVIGGGFIYGGFPRKLNEAKSGLPNEMIVDLIRSNSHEGYDPEDAEQYPLLPADVHSSVADLIEDELEIGQSAEIPRGLNYSKHVGDLTKALGILRNSGHGNHPAAMHIGDLAARFQDAQESQQY